jgi:hypothetical protein
MEMAQVKCTLTSTSIFDRLSENGTIVRQSGAIKKCFEEYYTCEDESGGGDGLGDPIEVADELRKVRDQHPND